MSHETKLDCSWSDDVWNTGRQVFREVMVGTGHIRTDSSKIRRTL